MNQKADRPPVYLTVQDFVRKHWHSESSIRWLIHKKDENGFGVCLRRIGRRILINETEFFKWLETQTDDGQYKTGPQNWR